MYLVLLRDEDGPTLKLFEGKSDFLRWMDEMDPDGFTEFLAHSNPNLDRLSLDSFPARTAVVFKGEIVIPFAKQIIQSFDVP